MEETTKNDAVNLEKTALEQCQVELQQVKETCLRINADFENFKKRTARERVTWIEEARAEVFLEVLKVVDDFDRALNQSKMQAQSSELAVWMQGFEMIHKALYDLLARYEIKPMASGMPFDPQFHEAIAQVEGSNFPAGEIVETVQKGFLLKERVLRVAQVVVSKSA